MSQNKNPICLDDIQLLLNSFESKISNIIDKNKAAKHLTKLVREAVKAERYNYSISQNLKSLNAGLKHLERYKSEYSQSRIFPYALPVLPMEHIPSVKKMIYELERHNRGGGPIAKAATVYFDCRLLIYFGVISQTEPTISHDESNDSSSDALEFVMSTYKYVRDSGLSPKGAWAHITKPDLRRRLSKIKKNHYSANDVDALTHELRKLNRATTS